MTFPRFRVSTSLGNSSSTKRALFLQQIRTQGRAKQCVHCHFVFINSETLITPKIDDSMPVSSNYNYNNYLDRGDYVYLRAY